eukprot:Opistho-2@58978
MPPRQRLLSTSDEVVAVRAPIDKYGRIGMGIRDVLLQAQLAGVPLLVSIQSYRTPTKDLIMQLTSFLGTEEFYTPLVVFMLWLIDARLGRLFAVLLAIGFYIANSIKDFLCLPRPPLLNLVPLEKAQNWALPSHHALMGTILPWFVWIYLSTNGMLNETWAAVLFFVTIVWSSSVNFSRLYLAVHSPADIVTGIMLGIVVLGAWLASYSALDDYVGSDPSAPYVCVAVAVALIAIYPVSEPATTSYADCAATLGVAIGFIIGRSCIAAGDFPAPKALLESGGLRGLPWYLEFCVSLIRLAIGFAMVMITRSILKAVIFSTTVRVCRVFGRPYVRDTNKDIDARPVFTHYLQETYRAAPEDDATATANVGRDRARTSSASSPDLSKLRRSPVNLDIPVKFLSYAGMGWMAVQGVPRLYEYFWGF